MFQKDTKISVLGDGGWGTTLALVLAGQGRKIHLWGNFAPYIVEVAKSRENTKFLPGFKIPELVVLTSDLKEACAADLIVVAAPSQYVRSVVKKIGPQMAKGKSFVSVAKGIEPKTLKAMSQAFREELGKVDL